MITRFNVNTRKAKKSFVNGVTVTKESSIPDASNDDYFYRPKPANIAPPIGPHFFNYIFAEAASRKSIWAFWQYGYPQELTFHDGQSFVQRIPQRYYDLDSTSSEADQFWGILACDQLSVFTCFVYAFVVLIIVPPVVWWSVRHGTSENLPFMFASTITTTVCIMLAWYYVQASRQKGW